MASRTTTNSGEDQEDAEPSQLRSFLEGNPLYRLFARWTDDRYRPEKHYMRGPGPKAKAKAEQGEAPSRSDRTRPARAR